MSWHYREVSVAWRNSKMWHHSKGHKELCIVLDISTPDFVLTTEWLPWLQRQWYALVCNTRLIAQFILQPQYTDNFQNTSVRGSLLMHFKVAVRNFHALSASRWFPHRCSEVCLCIVVVRWTGQLPLGVPYVISLQYQSKPLITTVSPVRLQPR